MRYIDKLTTIPPDDAAHPLIIGTAMHTGLELGLEEAIKQYYMSYPIITDRHIEEAMKFEKVIPKAEQMIPSGEFEVKIDSEHFVGFIDLLAPTTIFERAVEVPNQYDIYDFKYSNNVSHYKKSKQLHLYKYFWEKENPGKTIRNLYYLFVPKASIRQKKTENLVQFRKRLEGELEGLEPKIVQVEYDSSKVIDFMLDVKELLEAKEFKHTPDYLFKFSEFHDYIEKGIDYMLLPKNERRNIEKIEKKVLWLYGSPFSGKTTFANYFPEPLMLNTDGNVKFVDAPYISIRDQVSVEGRMTKRTLAWQTFKDVISELEKKDNDFKTIIVDLVEDTYDHCRLYMYDQMGISHESDDSFRAWDKVRTEFLSTLKKLMNLDYENIILISHEDTSKDITKKGGDKITAIKPNIQEKTANKVAGMVDIVARVVADGEIRTLSFKTNEVIFGGGRLTAETNEIPLEYDDFIKVYEEANKAAVAKLKGNGKKSEPVKEEMKEEKTSKRSRKKKEEPVQEESVEDVKQEETTEQVDQEEKSEEAVEESKPRQRRTLKKSSDDEPKQEASESEEKPKTRTRRKRGE